MKFAALGDRAVIVDFGAGASGLKKAYRFSAGWQAEPPPGILDVVPAYSQVAIFYEPGRFAVGEDSPYAAVCRLLRQPRPGKAKAAPRRARSVRVEIPVCFDSEAGVDLEDWARHAGLTVKKAVKLYCDSKYIVAAVGFAPGFPYLLGLPKKLAMPRRATPRLKVPAGSVGVAGLQTGVYPLATPGGWNLIGTTPLQLFDFAAEPPARLRVGDRVVFRAITRSEYLEWKY